MRCYTCLLAYMASLFDAALTAHDALHCPCAAQPADLADMHLVRYPPVYRPTRWFHRAALTARAPLCATGVHARVCQLYVGVSGLRVKWGGGMGDVV